MNASSFVSPPQLLALARELELPSCVCEQLVQTAVPALLDACAAQCMALTAPDTAFPAWKHLEAQFSGCCFSKRMRNFFRKNEKSVLQFCNKKPKRKGRLQRVEKSL